MPITASVRNNGAKYDRRLREELEREAQEAVRTHLQDHAGQHDRTRGRRLGVHVGQPGVERERAAP